MTFKTIVKVKRGDPLDGDLSVLQCLLRHRKAIGLNALIILFLICYTVAGGFVFLHFEATYASFLKQTELKERRECIEQLFSKSIGALRTQKDSIIATTITMKCLGEDEDNFRHEWTFKTATLYGFGILTTLGYGKIEPRTRNGRIFAVIYGFFGIPITIILLTNMGRYLERLALRFKRYCMRIEPQEEEDGISGSTLFCVILVYLVVGAILIPLLDGGLDFFNGIYFAFICLTAIEYGDLVPKNNWYVPIVIVYVCIGLAISTIALDIGSIYVRKLHYLGRKIRNIANIKIWFGARDLRVHELVNAVGHNIGLQESLINDIDIDYLVNVAIQVKQGRLINIPQTHVVEGIWPPELVPLFMKDGHFPDYVDSDKIEGESEKDDDDTPNTPPPIPDHKRRRSVRFEDEPESDALLRRSVLSSFRRASTRRASSPPPPFHIEVTHEASDLSEGDTSQVTTTTADINDVTFADD